MTEIVKDGKLLPSFTAMEDTVCCRVLNCYTWLHGTKPRGRKLGEVCTARSRRVVGHIGTTLLARVPSESNRRGRDESVPAIALTTIPPAREAR